LVFVYAKGAFTGLAAMGINIIGPTASGAGTIATYAGLMMAEATIATANIGLLIGAHPGGSTNYAAYLNSANAVYLGTGIVTGGSLRMSTPTHTNTLTQAFTGGTWYTILNTNVLEDNASLYLILLIFDNGGTPPFNARAIGLFAPSNVNSAGNNNAVILQTTCHDANGSPVVLSIRGLGVLGNVASGIQVMSDVAWGAGTTGTIKVFRISTAQ